MKQTMLRITVLVIAICLLPGLAWGQDSVFIKIDSLIQRKMREYRIHGLSVGIVVDGNEYLTKGYGYTSIDNKYPVTAQTSFVSGSISKLFTVTAIMQLVEQGKIDLNRRLIEYLPDFQMKDGRYKNITILQLITHSSGLSWSSILNSSITDSSALKKLVYSQTDRKLNFSPGEKFSGDTYSSLGYDILGYLVEKISGISFPRYVKLNILNVTGMEYSTFSITEIPENKLALPLKLEGNTKEINRFNLYGEVKDKNPVLKYPGLPIVNWTDYKWGKAEHNPSGYLYSTAQDLTNWMIYCLKVFNDTNNNSNYFLKHSTLIDMWKLKRGIENKKTSIGLGWWRYSDTTKGNYVFHVGRDPGYSSTLMIFPKNNAGITILCNAMYADQIVWNDLPFEILKMVNEKHNSR